MSSNVRSLLTQSRTHELPVHLFKGDECSGVVHCDRNYASSKSWSNLFCRFNEFLYRKGMHCKRGNQFAVPGQRILC